MIEEGANGVLRRSANVLLLTVAAGVGSLA